MPERVQVADLEKAPPLRVVDTVIDTYTRPAQRDVGGGPVKSGLTQLAESLVEIEPKLTAFLKAREEKFAEEEIARAKADRLKNQKSWAELVKANPTLQGLSPYYIKAYKAIDGELAARQQYGFFLAQRLQDQQFVSEDFENEADAAEAYATLVEKARSEFLSQHNNSGDIDWLLGFDEARQSIEDSSADRTLRQRLSANEEKYRVANGLKINEILESDISDEEKAAQIKQLGDDAIGRLGYNGTKWTSDVADQLESTALAQADRGDFVEAEQTLELAEIIPTGTGNLAGITSVKDKLTDTRLRISGLQIQRENYAWSRLTRGWSLEDRQHTLRAQGWAVENQEWTQSQRDRALDEQRVSEANEYLYADALMSIMANPNQDFTTMFQILASTPETAPMVPKLQAILNQRINSEERISEDPGVVAQLKQDIQDGIAGPEDVIELARNRGLNTGTVMDLIDDYTRVKRRNETLDQLSPQIRKVINDGTTRIGRVIIGNDDFGSPATQALRAQAEQDYELQILDFITLNPNASIREVMQERARILKELSQDPQYSIDAADLRTSDDGRLTIQTPTEAEQNRNRTSGENPFLQ